MKTTLVSLLAAFSLQVHAVEPKLLDALIAVESGGRDDAIGDGGLALGALQIHAGVVADVNEVAGTKYRHTDMHDRKIALFVASAYLDRYATQKRLGRAVTDEDRARIWNGGPSGWKKKATLKYWQKVRRHL